MQASPVDTWINAALNIPFAGLADAALAILDVPDIVEWAEERFYVVETKRPIVLEPVQKAVLREFTRRGDDGRFIYRTGLYSTIKKSGKTSVAALFMLWAAETWGDFKEVYHLGNKLGQAKDRAFKIARHSIELSNSKHDWEITATVLRHLPTGNIIQALPVNAAGEAGGNQALTTWTEFHGYTYEENNRMWAELQPVPTQALSFRFVESYAGYEGESLLLKDIWDRGLAGERVHDEYPIYAAHGGLIAYIDTGEEARRMPWQTPDYYRQAEIEELPHEYRRLHLNKWVNSTNALVDIGAWDSLAQPRQWGDLKALPVVISCDASVSGDCTAMTIATYDKDADMPVEVVTRIWQPNGTKLDYSITLEPALIRALQTYRVIRVVYDPYQLHDVMTRLGKRFDVSRFEAFSQQGERLLADTDLVTRVSQGTLAHQGNPEVRTHLQNADGKASGEKAIRIVKRTLNRPIDAAVTISMAFWKAHEYIGFKSRDKMGVYKLTVPNRR